MTTDPEALTLSEPRQGLRQFLRTVRLVVGPPGEQGRAWGDVSDDPTTRLRIAGSGGKSDKSKSDTSTITVYNLNADSRAWMEVEGHVAALFASYESDPSPPLLAGGDIEKVEHKREGRDWITTLEIRDGGLVLETARTVETFDGATKASEVLARIASTMGLELVLDAGVEEVEYAQGITFYGPSRDALRTITRAQGADWLVRDGQLVITPSGEPLTGESYLISPATGLVDRVEKVDNKKGRGGGKPGVKFKVLLNPRLKAKQIVELRSQAASGLYQIKSLSWQIDSGWDQPFYTEVDAIQVA